MSGYAFTTIESGDPYIPQGHSLQRRKFAHIAFDAAQGRAARNNTDSKVLRKAVTVPRTARTRIRKSARADNHSVSEVFIHFVIYLKPGRLRFPYRFYPYVISELDSRIGTISQQAFRNVARAVGNGKNAIPSFGFQGYPALFQQLHQAFGRECVNAAFQKFCIAYNIFKKLFGRNIICYVAATFAGDINFFSGFFIPFQNSNTVSVFCSGIRSHKPGCPRADHNYIFHFIELRQNAAPLFSAL